MTTMTASSKAYRVDRESAGGDFEGLGQLPDPSAVVSQSSNNVEENKVSLSIFSSLYSTISAPVY